MADLFIDKKYLDEIIAIISKTYPKSIVWAYGSRVDRSAHEGSDLDLVVRDFGQDSGYISELKDELNDSDVPFLIDIFDFARLPESFQKEIEKNYIVLYNGKN